MDAYRPEMLEYLPKTAKTILDVGCNDGRFIQSLKQQNSQLNVWGIEPDTSFSKENSSRADKVLNCGIEEAIPQLPDNHFDVIFFNDVLEHVLNPDEVLEQIRRCLTDNGCVISSIPNVRHFRVLRDLLFKKDWVYVDSGVLAKVHLRFFTKKSIIRLHEESGYKVETCTGINKTSSGRPYLYNLLTLGLFGLDTRFLQFLTVAKPK